MTPERRQKLKELNEKARLKMIEDKDKPPEKTVYVWINGMLIDMPESIAKKYGHKY